MAPVVMIPDDYNDLPRPQRDRIIPICINTCDQHGRAIAPEWFSKGVAPIRKELVALAQHELGDPWRASELAEATILRLWARHGHYVGRCPSRRVLKKAIWIAWELKSGHWHEMKHPNLHLALDSLDAKIRDQALVDPLENPQRLEEQILLDSIEDRVERDGRADLRTIYQLLRRGHNWQEVADRMGVANRDIVKKRFYRWIKRAGIA